MQPRQDLFTRAQDIIALTFIIPAEALFTRLSYDIRRAVLAQWLIEESIVSRHFTRLLGALMAQVTDHGLRSMLAGNIWEEHGCGANDDEAHFSLFCAMQRSLSSLPTAAPRGIGQSYINDGLRFIQAGELPGAAFVGPGNEQLIPIEYAMVQEWLFSPQDTTVAARRFFDANIEADHHHSLQVLEIAGMILGERPRAVPLFDRFVERACQRRVQFYEELAEAAAEGKPPSSITMPRATGDMQCGG